MEAVEVMEGTRTLAANGALEEYLATHKLVVDLGDADATCSLGAINLILTGEVTERPPPSMSRIIAAWMIPISDGMPYYLRNSMEWKALLPIAAVSGRDEEREAERLETILDWLFGTVLPIVQPAADKRGFGAEWRGMCVHRTCTAATVAAAAAYRAKAHNAFDAARDASNATDDAGGSIGKALSAALAANYGTAYDRINYWPKLDPCGVLARLV